MEVIDGNAPWILQIIQLDGSIVALVCLAEIKAVATIYTFAARLTDDERQMHAISRIFIYTYKTLSGFGP